MTTKIHADTGIEFPDSTIQSSAAYLPIAFAAKTSAYQSMPQGAWTNIIFGTELLDSNGSYDPITGIFTALVAGWYHVDWYVELTASANTYTATGVFSNILQNGLPSLSGSSTSVSMNGSITNGSGLIYCAIGDTLRVRAYQENSASAAVDAAGRFSAYLVRKT